MILDAFTPMGHVKEIRLARERGSKVSRGFAFVEFHTMAVCRHVMHICGGGDEGRSTGHLTIDGSQTRLTYARESARNGPPPARVRDAKGAQEDGLRRARGLLPRPGERHVLQRG